ncbi:MAG: diguanylate cyclase, partial [Desulfobacteraceae bacterium]|nr:diguanylate cyclase [Desulfobacteraceae bacterium]
HEISYVSTSIGISIFPDDAEQIEDLVKKADQAMYGAKEKRNKFVFFT